MSFSINAGTYKLKAISKEKVSDEKQNFIFSDNQKYVIPVYQRPYSWNKEQIKKFISDIFISYWGYDRKSDPEPMFIGTMQLSDKDAGIQNIIDGQQRLTTSIILLRVLQLRCPEIDELNQLDSIFNCISTEVNKPEQQEMYAAFLNNPNIGTPEDAKLNKYFQNAQIINEEIRHLTHLDTDKVNPAFNPSAFLKHLYSHIYFVVIETKASLSKTLKIFDAINTTGLDLNAGDLFKIRMYEYLKSKDKKRGDSDIFNEISGLYQEIDKRNKEADRHVTNMLGVLQVYQFFLIAEYKLPTVLYSFATDTFFERLFDTIFNDNQWTNFKRSEDQRPIVLSITEIKDFIKIRFDWDQKWMKGEYGTVENAAILKFWWWSRYGRFWILKFIFLYKYKEDPASYEKLYEFSQKLVRIYFIYSIKFKRQINAISGGFTNSVISVIVHESFESLMKLIDEKLKSESENESRNWFKTKISGDLRESNKMKNLVCRLAALFEENPTAIDPVSIKAVREKLFDWKIDIEHIQSNNDENGAERPLIIKEWGTDLHSLGNLVVLERTINRSVSNKLGRKAAGYKESKFIIVNKRIEALKSLTLEACKERKKQEVEKITNYLFEGTLPTQSP